MKLLVDTCTFLWLAADGPELSPAARTACRAPENEVYLSSLSAWEIAIKHRLGRLPLPEPQKAVVGNNLPDVQPPRAVVPTQVRVARTQPQRRRHEAQNPQHARLRLQQIRQTAARRPDATLSGADTLVAPMGATVERSPVPCNAAAV